MNKPGKGITKSQVKKENDTDFYGFFRIFKNRFWNLSSLNMLYVIVNFPIFFGLLSMSGIFNFNTTAPSSPYFAPLFGMVQYGETPYLSMLMSTLGSSIEWSAPSVTSNVLGYLTLLIVFTFGISNTGATYVIRGFLRSEPVFLFSDFFGTIKKNFRQAFILGIIDSLLIFVLVYGIMTYYAYQNWTMFFVELFIAMIYLTMRFYMYMLLITFDISIMKILKNSFIFALVGFGRNLCGWLGIAMVFIFNIFLFGAIPMFAIILPFILTIALLMFISGFTSYPVIKKYMIDPYYSDEKKDKITSVEEPIFVDRG